MRFFGFSEPFIRWVEECVITPTFSICINGAAHGFFKGARGVRQGDPMSLYLFLFVIEVFRLIIQRLIEQDNTYQFHRKCGKIGLFQLGFADDLLLYSKATDSSIAVFQCGLDVFATLSGLHVNPRKSHLILSKAARVQRPRLLKVFGFQEDRWSDPRMGRAFFVIYSMSPVNQVCSNGDEHILGKAFILPKGIIREIETRLREFLWKGISNVGYPKGAWSQVCKPVTEGGLGMREIRALNLVMMPRRLWDVVTQNKASLWVQWIYHFR
ncbi:UNVERIFIED_CONTAM: hypothetical protein Sradi_3337600 [Sesamum radiatum]|uniref:Reverse transcriptase domain-containing protein n=1 Tax=Sesamum radiatum TaxID=300843 RepID=A0AAW2R2X1_SESRA